MNYSAIILVAGKGTRTNLEYNKIFYQLKDGTYLVEMTMRPFLSDENCKQIIMVTTEGEKPKLLELFDDSRIEYTYGGKTRQDSVYNGLQCVNEEYVMIHDGARCFIEKETLDKTREALEKEDACLVMVPATDTIKKVENGYVKETFERKLLFNAQTPQSFKTSLIKECYEKGKKENYKATDDAQLVERYSNVPIFVVHGQYSNIKVTTEKDIIDLLGV